MVPILNHLPELLAAREAMLTHEFSIFNLLHRMILAPVLYVEDNQDDVYFMQLAFTEAALLRPLAVVTDGQQAFNYLAGLNEFADRSKHPLPCLLLLDLTLPIKSGFEILRWIRSQPELKDLQAVVVSSSSLDLDIQTADELGVIDYFVKPSDPMLLAAYLAEGAKRWMP